MGGGAPRDHSEPTGLFYMARIGLGRPGHDSGELGHSSAMAASAHDRQLQRRGDAVVAVDGMSVELGMGRPRGSNTYSSSGSSSFAARQWRPWPQLGVERLAKLGAAARERGRRGAALAHGFGGAEGEVARGRRWDARQRRGRMATTFTTCVVVRAFPRARGGRRCGQGGRWIGPDLGRFRPQAQNKV